jgi:hypothetical protein
LAVNPVAIHGLDLLGGQVQPQLPLEDRAGSEATATEVPAEETLHVGDGDFELLALGLYPVQDVLACVAFGAHNPGYPLHALCVRIYLDACTPTKGHTMHQRHKINKNNKTPHARTPTCLWRRAYRRRRRATCPRKTREIVVTMLESRASLVLYLILSISTCQTGSAQISFPSAFFSLATRCRLSIHR